ncbi:hypothetical protein QUF70_03185 [Desulfobacterales bacterium HSG17]|nr:hypothetical protein [Desulfobacterales bacterium HSG17]
MKNVISPIWQSLPDNIEQKFENCIAKALTERVNNKIAVLLFRADGVGVPGKNFSRLMELFMKYNTPLSLAVVPGWLYESRWNVIKKLIPDKKKSLFCWHQHGWRHVNNGENGARYEFGSNRFLSDIIDDLESGWLRLESVLGRDFYPAFIPPWNTCDDATIQLIREMKYNCISRFQGIKPLTPKGLADFPVNVDLHTRDEQNQSIDWGKLYVELKYTISHSYCAIMIHHQNMNDNAFEFLEILLKIIGKKKNIKPVNLKTLCEI